MSRSLSCPNGHAWECDVDDTQCPVCGSAAESLGRDESSTWDSGIVDELPPPPGMSSRGSTADSPIGSTPRIAGYEIGAELGRGGMGVVYEARHVALNRRVALKVIRGFAGRDEVARFRAEAEAVARLQHPNIVQIFDVGEHAGLPYLALEFADGGSLATRLRASPLAPREAAELVATLARAVQHANSRGVVHRDLKPANVLLAGKLEARNSKSETEGQPSLVSNFEFRISSLVAKVGDFGLAKLADDPGRSRSGQIVGTPSYMAPEQAAGRGDLVGPPADVWALGAILYECLTARPPFLGTTSIETVQQVLTIDPTPPARVKPGVPRDLETICLKCLRKEPEARYRGAGDLADDLARFLEGKPVHARRTPRWERLKMWAKRRPAAAALVAVVVGASAALSVLGYRYFRNLETHNAELEAKNTTISKNNAELEERNVTITNKSNALELANAATIKERDRAEDNLFVAVATIARMLTDMGLNHVAHIPHLDKTRAGMLEEALRLCDRLLVSQAGDPRLRLLQAMTLQRSGYLLTLLGQYTKAEERFERALALIQEHRREGGAVAIRDNSVMIEAITRLDRGKLSMRLGDTKRAREEYDAALALLETHKGPPDPVLKFFIAAGNANLGVVALDKEDVESALLHFGRARQYLEELFVEDSKDVAYVGAYAFVLNSYGVACLKNGETDRAAELFEKGIAVSRQLLTYQPANVTFRAELARCLSNFGGSLRVRGFLKRAAKPIEESLAIREELARNHEDIGPFGLDLSWSYLQTGQLYQSRDEFRVAIEWLTKAIDRLTKDRALLEKEAHARVLLADVYHARAGAREQLKLFLDAADDMSKAIEFSPAGKRPAFRILKAWLLADAGEIAKAAHEVEGALAKPEEVSPEMRFNAGLAFAKLAKQPDRAEEYARRAVKELTLAAEADYFRDPKRRGYLDELPALKHLRTRDDFNDLRAKVRRK